MKVTSSRIILVLMLAAIPLFAAKAPVAKDMILTTLDGVDILLRADNTWEVQGGKNIEFEKDFTVPVSGGKIVLISLDGTWGYVKKEIQDENVLVPATSITGKGHAVSMDVAVATAKAQNQALAQVNSRMKTALKQLKTDRKKMEDCVKRVEKDVDKKEVFKKGVGWDVSIVINLDRGSILAVADCAMIRDNDSTAEKTAKPADSQKSK